MLLLLRQQPDPFRVKFFTKNDLIMNISRSYAGSRLDQRLFDLRR